MGFRARDERRNRNRALSSSEGTAEAPKAEEGFMEVDHRRRRRQSSSTATQESRGGRRNYYRDDMKGRLMYSEWLIDVPADLQQDWVMIPAPSGKRVLVLAENVSASTLPHPIPLSNTPTSTTSAAPSCPASSRA